MTNTPLLSGNAQDRHHLSTALDQAARERELAFECMLPAKIVSFDRAKNVAEVQILIAWVEVNDTVISRHPVVDIPVISLGGGGFHISFPLKKDDLGWIYAADRDLSAFLSTLKEARPSHGRAHKFEQGMFVPDVYRQYTINSEDSGAMVIQSTSGASRISIRGDNIKITTSTVTIDAPQTNITGNVTIDKQLLVKEKSTLQVDAVINGISFVGHKHTSTTPGTPTSVPLP